MVNKLKNKIPKQALELLIITGLSVIVLLFAIRFDILERVIELTDKYEKWELDELITVIIFLAFSLMVYLIRRIKEYTIKEADLKKRNTELQEALCEIKELKSIIPICASCKKIRDDEGYWQHVDAYIEKFTKIEFSHGLCQDCAEKLYPSIYNKENSEEK